MQIDRRLISHFDWTLFLLVLSFVAIGITTIYSANYNLATGHAGALPMRQFTWLALGLIAMFVAISFDYHYIDRLAYPFYGLMLLLLILVIIIGHSGGGSQRWINLGFFRLQPGQRRLSHRRRPDRDRADGGDSNGLRARDRRADRPPDAARKCSVCGA